MSTKLTLMALSFMLAACASSDKVRQLDTSIDPKGQVSEGVVGLQNDVAVIQEKRRADEEMRSLQWQNYQLEGDLQYEQGMIHWCYEDLSDARLGGTGEVRLPPANDGLKPAVEVREELGLDQNDLVVVRTTKFKDKLEAEKAYQQALYRAIRQAKEIKQSCEGQMSVARQKAGLPSKRYQGKSSLTPDGRVKEVLEKHENSLDDAFEIKQQKTLPDVKKEEVIPVGEVRSTDLSTPVAE